MMVVPKRGGGHRTIYAPHWPLKNIQNKIRLYLEGMYRPSPRVMGFVRGRGIRSNAALHVGKRLLLNIDLKEYFPSIHIGRIRGRLRAPPYSLTDDVATTIAKLCTLDGVLPIGAPSSPILANMVTSALDGALTTIARENGCFYTRYADDITFSTNRRSFPPAIVARAAAKASEIEIGNAVLEAISANGFQINPGKTRLMQKHDSQEVCGVICNERLNPRRNLLREVRGALNAWRKHGREAAEEVWQKKYNWREAISLERSLRGKIEHIIHIKGENDPSVALLVQRFNELPGRIYKGITYRFDGDRKENIARSIAVIEAGSDEKLVWNQGSGFAGPGGIIITNYHVISHDGEILENVEALFPYQGGIRHEMAVVFSDKDQDIAILRVKNTDWSSFFDTLACALSFREMSPGDAIWLGGYPSYTVGDGCSVLSGEVASISNQKGRRIFRISQTIVKGNSGGPVFDIHGQVVGIATWGVDTHDVANVNFNGCIPLHSVDRAILQT